MFEVKYCIKFSKNKRASVKTCSFVCIFEVRLFIVRFLSDYFSAIIKTAMLTYRMRTDFCVALWALNQVGRAYLPVCSSCVLSLFRCFSFWYCHSLTSDITLIYNHIIITQFFKMSTV